MSKIIRKDFIKLVIIEIIKLVHTVFYVFVVVEKVGGHATFVHVALGFDELFLVVVFVDSDRSQKTHTCAANEQSECGGGP